MPVYGNLVRETCSIYTYFFLFIIIIFFSLPSKYIYVFMCVYNITRRHVRCFTRFPSTYHAPTVHTTIYYRLPSPSGFLYAIPIRRSRLSSQITPADSLRVILATPGVSTPGASVYFEKQKNSQYKTRTLVNEYC